MDFGHRLLSGGGLGWEREISRGGYEPVWLGRFMLTLIEVRELGW